MRQATNNVQDAQQGGCGALGQRRAWRADTAALPPRLNDEMATQGAGATRRRSSRGGRALSSLSTPGSPSTSTRATTTRLRHSKRPRRIGAGWPCRLGFAATRSINEMATQGAGGTRRRLPVAVGSAPPRLPHLGLGAGEEKFLAFGVAMMGNESVSKKLPRCVVV